MTKKEVQSRIEGLDEMQAKNVICALVGHSRIVTMCFGYVSCARCEDQIGDKLASVFDTTHCVVVGHNCETCQKNYAQMTWRDKWLTPDPFANGETEVEE